MPTAVIIGVLLSALLTSLGLFFTFGYHDPEKEKQVWAKLGFVMIFLVFLLYGVYWGFNFFSSVHCYKKDLGNLEGRDIFLCGVKIMEKSLREEEERRFILEKSIENEVKIEAEDRRYDKEMALQERKRKEKDLLEQKIKEMDLLKQKLKEQEQKLKEQEQKIKEMELLEQKLKGQEWGPNGMAQLGQKLREIGGHNKMVLREERLKEQEQKLKEREQALRGREREFREKERKHREQERKRKEQEQKLKEQERRKDDIDRILRKRS